MTSGVIVLNIPLDVVNSVCSTVYGGALGSLNGQFHDSNTGVTVTWQISQPPTFTKDQGFAWLSASMPFTVMTQPGNDSVSATGSATIECDASGSDQIQFSFTITDLTFACTDEYVQMVLQANSQAISDSIQNILNSCTCTLDQIGSLVFASVYYDTNSVAGEAAVIVTGCTDESDISNVSHLDQLNAPGSVAIGCDAAFAKKVLDAIWWSTATKQYSASSAEVSLDSYDASFSNGTLQLSLSASGKIEIAGAKWNLDIDTVQIVATPAFDGIDKVVIGDISVSKPGITPKPENALAWLYGLFYGPLLSIISAVASSFAGGQIRDALKAELCTQFFKLPSPSASVSGYTIGLKAQNVSFGHSDDWPFIAKGGLAVTVAPTAISAPLLDSFATGQIFPYPGDIPLHGLGAPNAQVSIKVNDQQTLPQTPTVKADGTWDYGSYSAYDGPSNTLSITQTLGSLASKPATYTYLQLEAPSFTSPANSPYPQGAPITVTGTAADLAGATVSVFLDGTALPNNPVSVQSGLWDCGTISPDVGPHALTAHLTVNDVDSPQSPAQPFSVCALTAPKFTSPENGKKYPAGTSIPVAGTAVDQPNATVSVFLDQTPLPNSPTPVGAGMWNCGSIGPDVGGYTLTAYQTLGGIDSPLASCSFEIISPTPSITYPAPNAFWPRDQALVVQGHGVPNATISLFLDNVPFPDQTTVDGNGNWTGGEELPNVADGPHTLSAIQTFTGSGFESDAATRTIVVYSLTIEPPPPHISSPYPGAGLVQGADFTISGTAEPYAIVALSLDNAALGSTMAADDGGWQYDAGPLNVDLGSHTVSAVQTVLVVQTSDPQTCTFSVVP